MNQNVPNLTPLVEGRACHPCNGGTRDGQELCPPTYHQENTPFPWPLQGHPACLSLTLFMVGTQGCEGGHQASFVHLQPNSQRGQPAYCAESAQHLTVSHDKQALHWSKGPQEYTGALDQSWGWGKETHMRLYKNVLFTVRILLTLSP